MLERIAKHGPLLQKVLIGVLVGLFFAAALYLRIAQPYDTVFSSGGVKFTGVDGYYNMRIVDSLVHNFPHINSFDPYMIFPGGSKTNIQYPLFQFLLAALIWIVGLGSPSQHMIDVIGVYVPAISGALMVMVVYFLGRTLFNRWAGVVSAGIIAITPGDFLGRSILGFTDYHIAEALFTSVAMLFLLLALKNAKREPLTLADLRHPRQASLTKPIVYAVLAGVFFGMYLIGWLGALLFVFILGIFFVFQFVMDHFRQRNSDYLCLVGSICMFVALLISLFVARGGMQLAALIVGLLMVPLLWGLSRLMAAQRLKPVLYPVVLVVLGLIALGIFRLLDYSTLKSMFDSLEIFAWNRDTTNAEMQPLLLRGSDFTPSIFWATYGYSLIFALVALGMLFYAVMKRGEPEKALLAVWTLVILLATFGQRRFNYYLAVSVVLLAGYAAWGALRLAGAREGSGESDVEAPQQPRGARRRGKRKSERTEFHLTSRHLYVTAVAVVIFCIFTLVPYRYDKMSDGSVKWRYIIDAARTQAHNPSFAPTDAWHESLTWLRENVAEQPFGDADFYYARYDTPFDYSQYPNAYGVTSWWDYGWWILRIGHLPPSVNPGSSQFGAPAHKVANLFVTQDETSAVQIADDLATKYVIVDYLIPMAYVNLSSGSTAGKFSPIVSFTDHAQREFFDVFYEDSGTGSISPRYLYYFPAYYRSMCVRMYYFLGEEFAPDEYTVVSYEERTIAGHVYKVRRSESTYKTYEEALAASQVTDKYKHAIVSSDPYNSAIPLEKLEHFHLIHESGSPTEVRVFEYVK